MLSHGAVGHGIQPTPAARERWFRRIYPSCKPKSYTADTQPPISHCCFFGRKRRLPMWMVRLTAIDFHAASRGRSGLFLAVFCLMSPGSSGAVVALCMDILSAFAVESNGPLPSSLPLMVLDDFCGTTLRIRAQARIPFFSMHWLRIWHLPLAL